MSSTTEEILDLNKRVSDLKERTIRLQSRRETLIKSRDELISEIKAAGYKPKDLVRERKRLKDELFRKKAALEEQLTEAERILSTLPE